MKGIKKCKRLTIVKRFLHLEGLGVSSTSSSFELSTLR